MRFSLSWLKEHLNTTATTGELADKMVDLGIEVEAIEDEAAAFNNVIVGHIMTREQHGDADRLGICTVDVGEDTPRTIVCGAPNARDNLTVAVAVEGAVLPGDFEIKPTKIRGVKSNGMICSVRELALGDEHEGIMELETDKKAGTPFAEVWGSTDVVFDVALTPNRGDALSVYGIARDLAASGIGELIEVEHATITAESPSITTEIQSENCRFFTGQLISDVQNTESPTWLKKRLEQAGLRPINAIADITNYIMLTYGQPLHAYDADKLKGNITVQTATEESEFAGLDGNAHKVAAGDIIICDDCGVIGLGGIVGGESTSVELNTSNVYLEAAQFNAEAIAVTGQRLQCNTDARARFERGTDPAMTVPAALAAMHLIIEICGGNSSNMEKVGHELPEPRVLSFDPTQVQTFGGLELSKNDTKETLEKLGYHVADDGALFKVTVPSHVTIMDSEADLVEDILRLQGYDTVPTVLPPLSDNTITTTAPNLRADRVARRSLAAMGYLECINYSFISAEHAAMFAEGVALYTLANPIDADTMSTMRPSLIPSLAVAATQNIARSEGSVTLAEVGKTYTEGNEVLMAAGLRCGSAERHWQGNTAQADVFTAKADALKLLEILGLPVANLQVRNNNLPSTYHPGRSGVLALGKNVFATFGEMHPKTAKKLGLKGTVVLFEINLTACDAMKTKQGAYFTSTYQAAQRDFSFLVGHDIAAGDVMNTLKGANKELVRKVTLFDAYEGERIKAGKKSLALRMTLQAADRTLTEEEINKVCDTAVSSVQKRFHAEVR